MAFQNRIRLPIYLTRPQFPDEKTVRVRADGSRKTQNIVISKEYEGVTEKFPEWVHERLKIALNHDTVIIEGERYFGELVVDGYEIEWTDFMDYPYGPATFKARVNPYGMVNSNCKSCEAAAQLDLTDDNLPDSLLPSTTYEINVFANDSIYCRPFTASITFTSFPYVDTATLDEATGMLTITTKPLFFQRNIVHLVTYRVTCEDGSYDEARVYAPLAGDPNPILEPTGLHIVSRDSDSAVIGWTALAVAPENGYDWKLAEQATPAVIVDEGNTASDNAATPSDPTQVFLHPSTPYMFSVRANYTAGESDWVDFNFSTDPLDENECGRYRVTYFDEFTSQGHKDIQYIACNGSVATVRLQPYKPKAVCALQNQVGQPVSIIGADEITYFRPC
jgi:hypothetical protein